MKSFIFYTAILLFFSFESFAEAPPYPTPSTPPYLSQMPLSQKQIDFGNNFRSKTFFSLEYSAPEIKKAGAHSRYSSGNFGKQMSNFENIAVGMHFRTHRYLGFNFNWAQSNLSNWSLPSLSLERAANFNIKQYNASALFFAPIKENILELFAELGVSDIYGRLTSVETSGRVFDGVAHKTLAFAGVGVQLSPFDNSNDSFRFTFQEYAGKLPVIDSRYSVVRFGYLKSF
jgi:hypothetical protein